MPIEPVAEDPIRQYGELEQSRLTRNLLQITQRVRTIDKGHEYSLELICSWHAHLFRDVRDHAGRYRTATYGEDRLTFGPHRSAAKEDVPLELAAHFRKAHNLYAQLDRLESSRPPEEMVEQILTAALYLHADLIKIHPFRDGNGRVGRLILTYHLCRFGLPPIAIEVPRQEYLDCLNHFYSTNELGRLVSLALRLYQNQLPPEQ